MILAATSWGLEVVSPAGVEPIREGPLRHLARSDDSVFCLEDSGTVVVDDQPVGRIPDGYDPTCLLPTEDTVWVGCSEARLLRLHDGRWMEDEAFLEAPGRDTWFTPWGGPPDVRSLTRTAEGEILVNVHVGGILRRGPGGWIPTVDIEADVHQVCASVAGPVGAATARGLFLSNDGFRTWEEIAQGLHARYCRAVAWLGDTPVVSVSTGPGGARSAVYLVDDHVPKRISEDLRLEDNVDTHCLAVRDGRMAAAVGRVVYMSDDRGATWSAAGTAGAVRALA
ncbi:MAG: hypothetical protein KatS3mg011_1241 [Acidimicrobiia bacterium]|nr:MAG: hypothetical protein KatS3mg011_1241 [Acidimicrobiia bacterium]